MAASIIREAFIDVSAGLSATGESVQTHALIAPWRIDTVCLNKHKTQFLDGRLSWTTRKQSVSQSQTQQPKQF